jgi:hypothetical protein
VTWPDGSTLSITYDPLGLRNEEVLKNSSGTVVVDNKILWLGGKIVSDGTNNYWPFGQTTGNSQYYLGTDHLGSIRDVTDANGNLVTPLGALLMNPDIRFVFLSSPACLVQEFEERAGFRRLDYGRPSAGHVFTDSIRFRGRTCRRGSDAVFLSIAGPYARLLSKGFSFSTDLDPDRKRCICSHPLSESSSQL